MQWYYSKNSMQLGPVSQAELLAKVASGEILRSDMVWRDGMTDWTPASSVAELGLSMPAPPPQSGQVGNYAAPYAAPGHATVNIPNYLWQSIVVTILCCWPCGIPAIVYAAKVDGLKLQGNIQGAMEASANAKKWCIISLVGFGVVILLYLLLVFSVMLTSNA